MKKLLDWFLLTSSYTACCAVALCMATERFINGITPPVFNALHIFIFGCTLLVYNLHHGAKRIVRMAKNNEDPPVDENYIPHLLFAILGLAVVLGSCWFLNWKVVAVCIVSGFVSFAYSLPLLPFKNIKRIRELGWLKILDLALVWTVVTSVLPILYWHKGVTDYPYEILLRFVFLFTLCILFDIRDIRTDEANNINTLPQIIGLRNSYWLMNLSSLAFIALSYFQYLRYGSQSRFWCAVVAAVLIRLVADLLKKRPTEKSYIFFGDGVMIAYSVLVILTQR